MLRRLLAAGGARVGVRPMLATAYAANAVSVSVPLAGPALATAFTFRRFTRQGADAPLAGWSLLAGGVTSSAAAALIVVGGGLASGNIAGHSGHRSRWRARRSRPGRGGRGRAPPAAARRARAASRWTLRQGSRMLRRPAADPRQTIQAWAQRLGSLRLSPAGWTTATGLALANWLADAAVLAVSIRATGATVPWHDLLLVYGSGIAAQSLNLTPGGLGVTEGSLGLALVATGLGASQALAAVLLYRLASFWLVALAGWLVVFWLRRPQARRGPGSFAGTAPSPGHARPPGWVLTNWCCCTGSPARPPTGSRSPDGCPPSFTPWHLTGRDTAPASFRRAGSPRTPAPSSTTWTRAASRARCSWGTPTAAGWRCRRRAWRPAGWRRWSCSRASARGA